MAYNLITYYLYNILKIELRKFFTETRLIFLLMGIGALKLDLMQVTTTSSYGF